MKTRTYAIVVGGILIGLGILLVPLLSILSLFISIPSIILGVCVIGFKFTRLKLNKITIITSSIIASYYLSVYILMLQSQALT